MRFALDRHSQLAFDLRSGNCRDLDDLLALEGRVFAGDRLSRRSVRHFLSSPRAVLLVAEQAGRLVGYALVLFTVRSAAARLYSIAVIPEWAGRGAGWRLLAAAEAIARERGRGLMRLEVEAGNATAIALYRKAAYREYGRRAGYYASGGDALLFQKPLYPPLAAARDEAVVFTESADAILPVPGTGRERRLRSGVPEIESPMPVRPPR